MKIFLSNPKIRYPLLALTCLAVCSFASGVARAQSTPTRAQRTAAAATLTVENILQAKKLELEQKIEERARRLISGLDGGQYLLYVKVELDADKIQKAYQKASTSTVRFKGLPGSATTTELVKSFLKELSSDDLFEYIKKMNFVLTLDSGLTNEQTDAIEKALKDALQLKDGRDTFSLQRAQMASASMRNKLEESARETAAAREQLRKLEDSMRELEKEKGKADTLEKDKKGLEEKLKEMERELRKAEDDKKRIEDEKRIADTKREAAEKQLKDEQAFQATPLGTFKSAVKGIELLLTIFPLGVLGLVALVIIGRWFLRAQTQNAKTTADGLNALAAAVGKIAKSGGLGGKADTLETTAKGADTNGDRSDGGQNFEFFQKEASMTWELLKKEPYAMQCVLKDWLSTAEGMFRFLCFSEAIGAENAKELWSKFPRSELESLTPLLYNPIPKAQAYATVGNLYRLVAKEIASKPAFFTQLDLEFLTALTDNDLAEALDQVQVEAVGCCLLFVSPLRAGRLLKLIKAHEKPALLTAFRAATDISQAEAKGHANEIKRAKPEHANKKGFDISAHVLFFLESSDGDLKNAVNDLLKNDEELGAKIREHMFTFDDVMRLDDDSLSEVLQDLEDTQLVTLLQSLPQQSTRRILSFYRGTRLVGIKEEFQRIEKKPALKKKARRDGFALQNELAKRVKAMVDTGQLLLENDATSTGSEGNQRNAS